MLDSTKRPKGSQRRLVRKRSASQAQSAAPHPQAVRREPGMSRTGRESANGSTPGLESRDRTHRPLNGQMNGHPNPGQPSPSRRTRRNAPNPLARFFQKLSAQQPKRSRTRQPGEATAMQPLQRSPEPERPQTRQMVRPLKTNQQPRNLTRPEPNKPAVGRAKRTPPLVYLVRLLIVGVGVGAIAGTVISVSDPSMRYPAEANSSSNSTQVTRQAQANPENNNQPGMLASITSVRMGREMTELVGKVTPLTQNLTDLGPGVFVLDLDNGDFFSFNGNTTFSSASMIKLPILVAFFQDVDAGKIKLDEMMSIEQADIAEGSGDMQYAGTGSQYSVLETATNMIITSDNTATNMIIRRMGGIEALNRRFQQWGMQQTTMRNLLADLEGTNMTSPKELVSLLSLINDGKLLSMKSRDRAFDIMRRTQTDTLLPSVLAPGSTIAHKTGDIGSMVGDVGVVDLPTGRRYAIAAMVKRPHNDTRAQELIRQIAALVYEQFGGQPVLVPSPIPPTQTAPQPMAPGMPSPTAPGMPGMPGMPTPTLSPTMTLPQTQMAPAPMAPVPVAPSPEALTPASPEPMDSEAVPNADGPTPVEPEAEASPAPADDAADQTL